VGLAKDPKLEGMGKTWEVPSDEPAKKRRNEFLDRLEDCAAEEDELDDYLRASFQPHQTK